MVDKERWMLIRASIFILTLLWMGGRFLPAAFRKWAILPAIVEPHGSQTLPSHKAKGAYSDLKFRTLKAHPI